MSYRSSMDSRVPKFSGVSVMKNSPVLNVVVVVENSMVMGEVEVVLYKESSARFSSSTEGVSEIQIRTAFPWRCFLGKAIPKA